MNIRNAFAACALTALSLLSCKEAANDTLDLSGPWTVALDSLDRGLDEQWYNRTLANPISLPGTLCDAGYGTPCSLQPEMEKEVFLNLKRKYDYVGPAWYRKEIRIPAGWEGKRVGLSLERVLWQSRLWVNGHEAGQGNESLTTPHRFDLSGLLRPGQVNVLVLRIDNRKRHDISVRDLAHAYTNDTQTMWNGVLGRMVLEAKDEASIGELRLVPDVDGSRVEVRVRLEGEASRLPGQLVFSVKSPSGQALPERKVAVAGAETVFTYPIPDPQLWDEFNPALYQATARLEAPDGRTLDVEREDFGLRKLTQEDALLHINGRRLFLRGTLECCIFPLTGYPPTGRQGWQKVFATARSYGLNHLRFHSWCPPEAAFEVADRMGFYLQVELPVWSLTLGQDKGTLDFMADEAGRIMREYGNHPSFCFWSLGNELQSDFTALDSLLVSMKREDPRHLYTTTSFTFEKGHGDWPEPHDDFWVSQWTRQGWVRGQGVFDDYPASFDQDFSAAVKGLPVPIVTHEVGQYSVYPDLKETAKYTGNLLPLNFMAVAADLERKGRSGWAEENLQASGRLAAILYKEEIERALKTPGSSGFQLLDLHDFPGQGTALVGLLNAFWDSKGLITPERFRRFCSPVVPLARFAKATYTNDETLDVSFEVANFGAGTLAGSLPAWSLTRPDGSIVAQGTCPRQDIPVGNALPLGKARIPLAQVEEAECLTLSLWIDGTEHANDWHVWVYPKTLDDGPGGDEVLYTRSFAEAGRALQEGRKVLLNPGLRQVQGLEGKFVQVFWSPVHFPNQPGTMGVACDPGHPAFSRFPTEGHSDWQWWDICKNARTMVLDSLGADVKPLIRMVDNFYKNRSLALAFEARVGKGRLLMCSTDLGTRLDERPVARQLRHSLLEYMRSPAFDPQAVLDFGQVERQLRNTDGTLPERQSVYD